MNNNLHIQSPCKRDCAERSPVCHAECKKYLEWLESRKPELEAREAKRKAEDVYYSHVREKNNRLERRFRRNK